ncbi:HGWP repeat containing protein-like [Oryza sativa Japonica Group]|uniref:cysteine dioxygenase n=1 Tax=Oryza sativa subsp. japonica TaxID=39947 RepID=Q5JM94_ORYSJ|nr:HGWP repeat containing protein-like [Oryza sativa Japonica Group]BAD87413.1 HGWP repeat containing protein-like [Oryza sativa Japonica Group]
MRLVGHTTVHGRPRLHRPAGLRRRRLVFPPARLAYYAAAIGHLRLHRRPTSVAADWCLRLHGWPIMPPLLGVYDFTAGLPPSPPSGASAYTAGLLCRRCWASTTSPPACLRCRRVVPPPTRLAYYAAAVGRLRLHRRPASVAADWCPRLYGWLVTPPFMGVHVFADRLAFAAADWCFRLHGWPIMPPLLDVYDFTAGLPPSPPTGVLAYTVGWSHHRSWASTSSPTGWPSPPPTGVSAYTASLLCRCCWASTTSPLACLCRRRLVFPPTRLAYYAAAVGRLRLHRRPASVAADWCPRLYGWLVTPPFMGVHVFADRLAFAAADWIQIQICIKGIHGFKLISYAPGMDQSEHHHRLALTAADWCFRLHGWPLCRRCWASTSSPTGLPSPPPTGVSACTAGLYAAVVGRLRLYRPACLRRCRLVFPPARLAFMPPLLGVYVFTDRLAFAAADWCFRLHGWPLCRRCWAPTSSPTGLPSPPPTGVSACTAGLYAAVVGRLRLYRPACLRRCRLVFPPARLAFMPPLLGVYVFTDRLAFAAADWCFRLHGWPLCRRCWASTSSPTGLPSPPPTGVSACTAGLYAAVVGRLRLHRPACLRRRRLVFPPARLAFMPPLLGVYVFTDRLAFAAADWCFRLHGWPLCRRCWASTSSPTGRLDRRRLVLPPARLAFMPPLLGVYVFTDRPPHPPLTGVTACTAGLL